MKLLKSLSGNAAANDLEPYGFDAQRADTILEEFKQQPVPAPLPLLKKLPLNWKPFYSSLIDTVRVIVPICHMPLERVAEHNQHMSRDGFKFFVRSPHTNAIAQVISRENGTKLLMEFSIPKFLTGQNVVGIERMHDGCLLVIKAICKLMKINPSRAERHAIAGGKYRLTRTDLVAHIDCGTQERASAVMIALRNHLVGKFKDVSFYDLDTIYISQHSRRRSLKIYNKGVELERYPMPPQVFSRERLMDISQNLVRLELVLRRDELADAGLHNPLNWNETTGRQLMDRWVNQLKIADGQLPNVALIDQLSPMLQHKFRAWSLGDAIAFGRGVGHDTYRESRSRVLKATGIDVDNHLSPEQQRDAVLTIRKMFSNGFGYRTWESKWDQLVDSCNGDHKLK